VFGFSREVFAHTNEYRDAFRAMVGQRSGAVVQRLLEKLFVELIREDVKRTIVRAHSRAAHIDEVLVHFIAGALVGVLMWWLDTRSR
jgi:F0F1-type ATP synthase assembly protein I